MRKRWLGILVVMILALSLGIGTVASAHEPTIEMAPQEPQEPQKIELKSFLEENISISLIGSGWLVETDPSATKETYILEFNPPVWQETDVVWYPEGYKYDIELFVSWPFVTPIENERINGRKIKLLVKVHLIARFDNMSGILEFYEKIFTAIEKKEKLSVKVELEYACREYEEIINPHRHPTKVYFRKK